MQSHLFSPGSQSNTNYYFLENFYLEHKMLKGKRVIVTGASSGIGEQMAYHLAQMGSHLLITARTEAKLQKVNGKPSTHICMPDTAFAEHVVKVAEELLGGLDMLILNHIGSSYFHYFDGDVRHVRKLLETNFLSYVAMTVSALPMLKESGGSIVVVSSMAGKVGCPFAVPYSATKFALDGFFSSLRQEFALQNTNVSITLCILALHLHSQEARRPRPAPVLQGTARLTSPTAHRGQKGQAQSPAYGEGPQPAKGQSCPQRHSAGPLLAGESTAPPTLAVLQGARDSHPRHRAAQGSGRGVPGTDAG
uniref:11-beta-hydroxysteroid dehydrogenase 1 n=1 Tax=Crocodylus porosus TaxID=8502 RepID=A0A7M4DUK6_CROPO